MSKIRIFMLSVRDSLSTGIMLAYFFVSTVVILSYALTVQMPEQDKVEIPLRPDPVPIADVFQSLTRQAASLLVIAGVIATAHRINDWLDKDALQLLLSMPFSRPQLLLLRVAGAVAAVALNVVYFVTAMAVVLGVRIGVWNAGFVVSSIAITIWFACLTALITLFAVLTRTNSWTLFYTYATYFFSAVFLEVREFTLFRLWENPVFHSLINFIYYVLPQFKSMSDNILHLSAVFLNPDLHRFNPFTFVYSSLSALMIYGSAIVYFSKKDF